VGKLIIAFACCASSIRSHECDLFSLYGGCVLGFGGTCTAVCPRDEYHFNQSKPALFLTARAFGMLLVALASRPFCRRAANGLSASTILVFHLGRNGVMGGFFLFPPPPPPPPPTPVFGGSKKSELGLIASRPTTTLPECWWLVLGIGAGMATSGHHNAVSFCVFQPTMLLPFSAFAECSAKSVLILAIFGDSAHPLP